MTEPDGSYSLLSNYSDADRVIGDRRVRAKQPENSWTNEFFRAWDSHEQGSVDYISFGTYAIENSVHRLNSEQIESLTNPK